MWHICWFGKGSQKYPGNSLAFRNQRTRQLSQQRILRTMEEMSQSPNRWGGLLVTAYKLRKLRPKHWQESRIHIFPSFSSFFRVGLCFRVGLWSSVFVFDGLSFWKTSTRHVMTTSVRFTGLPAQNEYFTYISLKFFSVKTRFKRRILHAPNQILILVELN